MSFYGRMVMRSKLTMTTLFSMGEASYDDFLCSAEFIDKAVNLLKATPSNSSGKLKLGNSEAGLDSMVFCLAPLSLFFDSQRHK